VSGNGSVFAEAPSVDAATGQLSFKPAPNAYGNSTWRIVLADDGGAEKRGHTRGKNVSVARMLEVEVLSVNDAPSFSISKPNMTVLATGFTTSFWEPSLVSDWKAGPPDEEASQTLSFSVHTDAGLPASVWASKPAVSLNGSLSMQIASDTSFETVLRIVLRDDGGTRFGGNDTFARDVQVYFIAVPEAITNLALTQTVERQLDITWSHVDTNRSSATLGRTMSFILQLSKDCSAYTTDLARDECSSFKRQLQVPISDCSPASCTAKFSALEPAVRYIVSVKAQNMARDSAVRLLGAIVLKPPTSPATFNMTQLSTIVAARSLLTFEWDR
jgi:hypothetical protein